MPEILIGAGLAAGAGVVGRAWRQSRKRRLSEERLGRRPTAAPEALHPVAQMRWVSSVLRRHRILPWAVGAVLALVLHYALGLRLTFALTFSAILGTLGTLLESVLFAQHTLRLETQLADAIDLLVSSLRAGGGLMQALETAQREAERPFRAEIEEVVGRIRLGDDPRQVLHVFALRVPLETFQLFATAVAVHTEVGGSLAPVLATVGRTIRDRIELTRRVRSQTTQAQLSVVMMLFISYFIAAVMWRSNPERMEGFLASDIGSALFAGAMMAQAFGLLAMRRISQIQV